MQSNEAMGTVEVDVKKYQEPANDVRRWLLQHHHGVLGTVNNGDRLDGWPFLSVAPFALDDGGQPLFQLADIAQHTRNVKADKRASLLVQEPTTDGDPQRGWRITLLGNLIPIKANEEEEVLARFAERVPAAVNYSRQHDFGFYRLHLERIRYIGGFGKIYWIPADAALREPLGAGLAEVAPGAIEHMNADHGSNLMEMCQGIYGIKPEHAEMVKLDRAGFLVRTRGPERLLHFSFGKEIDAKSLRVDMIDVVNRARAARPGVAQ